MTPPSIRKSLPVMNAPSAPHEQRPDGSDLIGGCRRVRPDTARSCALYPSLRGSLNSSSENDDDVAHDKFFRVLHY